MSRGQRVRAAVAWVGLGLIAGALAWTVVAAMLYSHEALHTGLEYEEEAARVVMALLFSCTIGCAVLGYGARWTDRDAAPEPEMGRAGLRFIYMMGLLLVAAVTAFPTVMAYPELTDDLVQATTARLQAWLVTGAVCLGFFLFMLSGRRPTPRPPGATFSAFVTGTLAAFLAGALLHTVPYPEVHHTTADAPGDPAPVPDAVSEVGWTWKSEPDASLARVEEGAHGPLVVLSDGVVSLDGTDGSEVWSFRRPADEDVEVVVGEQHVFVSYRPFDAGETEDDEESAFTETFDLATGEAVLGHEHRSDVVHDDLDMGTDNVARFPGQVVTRRSTDAESPEELLALEAGSGRELWSLPTSGDDQFCEQRPPEALYGVVVSTQLCMEQDDREGVTLDQAYLRDVDVEYVVAAFDPENGEELWQRRWAGTGVGLAADVFPGGHPAEGAAPVILVQTDRRHLAEVIDPATGEDAVTLPDDVDDEENWFEEFAGADSESATYLIDREDEGLVFERVNAQGEVTGTVDPGPGLGRIDGTSVALTEMVLFPSAVESRPTVVARSFDESEADEHIRVGGADDGGREVELLPVPGAVVVEVGGEGTVHGLVP